MVDDMESNQEKWVLILGGSRGLGLATAQKLGTNGFNLLIVHRDRANALPEFDKEVEKIKSNGVQVFSFNKDATRDKGRKEIIDSIKERIGTARISLMIHSIAKGSLKPILSSVNDALKGEDIRITVNAMGISFYDWASALLEAGLFSKTARVIAFTSEGSSKTIPGYAAVSAAKATLESLMKSMAVAFASQGLRVNCIQSGVVNTTSLRLIPNYERLIEQSKKRNPYKRLTTPEDVANVVFLLSSKDAEWINGCVIKVDGGESLI